VIETLSTDSVSVLFVLHARCGAQMLAGWLAAGLNPLNRTAPNLYNHSPQGISLLEALLPERQRGKRDGEDGARCWPGCRVEQSVLLLEGAWCTRSDGSRVCQGEGRGEGLTSNKINVATTQDTEPWNDWHPEPNSC